MMTMTQLIKLLIKQTQLKIPMKNQSTTLQITTVDMKKMKYHNQISITNQRGKIVRKTIEIMG